MTETTIPYLKVSGSYHEIGYQIGKAFKRNITSLLDHYADFKKHKAAFPRKEKLVEKMLLVSKRLCPNIVDEIQGISDGCGMDFMDIFIHNCMHMPHWANCSTSVFRHGDSIHIAHNEDAHPLLEENSYFIFVKPENDNSIPFFSHCYPGIVPGMSYGFNAAGLVQTCNSLPDPIKTVGLPRMFVGRKIYENAKTINDAIEIIEEMTPRSGGASYTVGSKNNVVNVETTGTDYAIIKIYDNFFRANHYISGKFKKHPAASRHTIVRQNRGDILIPEIKNHNQLLDMMWDNLIYLTMESTNNDCQTNATLLIDITNEDITMRKYSNFPNRDCTLIKLSVLIKG
jgi:isopenicillin-N N-acyltransferase like protein